MLVLVLIFVKDGKFFLSWIVKVIYFCFVVLLFGGRNLVCGLLGVLFIIGKNERGVNIILKNVY